MRPQADIKSAPPEICLDTSGIKRLGDDKLNVNACPCKTILYRLLLIIIMNLNNFIVRIIITST